MHYYKFNVSSWAKDTGHLSLKEEAIYLRLINYYYDNEKPIPLKTQLVLRKLRMADESETVNLILEEFFTKTKNGWTHHHCDKLIAEYQKKAETNRKNGRSGGRPKINGLDKPSGLIVGNESEPSGNLNYKLLTTNEEPVNNTDNTITPDGDVTPPPEKPKKPKAPPIDYLAIQEIWNANMTKASKVTAITDKRKRAIKKLFDVFQLDLEKFENYVKYVNSNPKCQWMFEEQDRGNGQVWQKKGFDYITSEACFLRVKEEY